VDAMTGARTVRESRLQQCRPQLCGGIPLHCTIKIVRRPCRGCWRRSPRRRSRSRSDPRRARRQGKSSKCPSVLARYAETCAADGGGPGGEFWPRHRAQVPRWLHVGIAGFSACRSGAMKPVLAARRSHTLTCPGKKAFQSARGFGRRGVTDRVSAAALECERWYSAREWRRHVILHRSNELRQRARCDRDSTGYRVGEGGCLWSPHAGSSAAASPMSCKICASLSPSGCSVMNCSGSEGEAADNGRRRGLGLYAIRSLRQNPLDGIGASPRRRQEVDGNQEFTILGLLGGERHAVKEPPLEPNPASTHNMTF
jgi:hypothetical protein